MVDTKEKRYLYVNVFISAYSKSLNEMSYLRILNKKLKAFQRLLAYSAACWTHAPKERYSCCHKGFGGACLCRICGFGQSRGAKALTLDRPVGLLDFSQFGN